MCWQVNRDLDEMRRQLHDDIRVSRRRGRVPRVVRVSAWALIVGAAILLRAPALAVLGIIAFEGMVAPALTKPHRLRELGQLAEWRVPESYRESPEALPQSRTVR
jgi:hypothetical protein